MHKSKSAFLILLSLIMLLSACGTPAPVEITEPVIVESEPTIAPTEEETIPEETLPPAMEITDFVLDTVDGEEFYTMNGFSYPAFLGEPELGLEGASALYQANDPEAAAKAINNIADAIYYISETKDFFDSTAVCKTFAQFLEDNYKDLGYIHLQGEDLSYCLIYVRKDNIYYPVDVFHIVQGLPSWTLEPENGCAPSEDPFSLCENLANTFPGDVEGWVMDDRVNQMESLNPTQNPFPWGLRGSELTQEEISNLYEAGNPYAAEQAITTVEDAITYLLMMDPKTRTLDSYPMDVEGRRAYKTFVYLVADDYEDVGMIRLMKRKPNHREGFYDESAYFGSWCICYVKQDGIYYPVDIDSILMGWASWTLMPENGCASNPDLNALCQQMADTCPWVDPHPNATATKNDPFTYWEITSYMYHQGTKMIPVNEFVIPEGLGHPVLSEEEIEALVQETDYEKIAQEITTLGDVLHFYNKLRLVKPRYGNSNPHPPFEYFQSAWQVLKDKTAYGFTACNLTRYLLKEDYDEIGYVFAQATKSSTAMMYIYEDGLYYLLCPDTYTTEPREDLWIEWPGVIGCAEDFQTIADSLVEHCWFMSPTQCEQVKSVYLIRCEGDFVIGGVDKEGRRRFPVGTEVTAYYAPEVIYMEATLDWQSQTRIDK